MDTKHLRKQYIIESQLQFWFILILVIIVTFEGIFVGWAMHRLSVIASDWQRPDIIFDFFRTLGLTLFLLVGINFFIGTLLSNKVAGPIFRLRRAFEAIRRGNLSHVQVRHGDILKDLVKDFNETIMLLDKLAKRDQHLVTMANDCINDCIAIFNEKAVSREKIEEAKKLFVKIKSYLTSINIHFVSHAKILER